MAINVAAKKRGWGYDYANTRLNAYVDGVEAFRLTKSSTGTDFRFLGDTPATNYLNYDASANSLTFTGNSNLAIASRTSGSGSDLGTVEEGLLVAAQYTDSATLINTTDYVGCAAIFDLKLGRAITLASGGGYGFATIWANLEVDKAINATGGQSTAWMTIWADASGDDAHIRGTSRLQVLDLAIVTGADFDLGTGCMLYGLRIDSSVNASATITGNFYAINIEAAGTKKDWTIGIDINDCTTGIDISACTTGINVAANTVIPQLITVGTLTNPMHWDGVASNILVYQENTDVTPASITANKFSLSAAQSAATTSGRLECARFEVKSYSTTAVTADMRALVGQVEFSGDMTYIGSGTADYTGAYAVIASIWSGSDVTANSGNTGHMYPLGIFFGLETGTSLSGEDAYIYIYNYGKVCPNSVLKLYNASTPEAPTYFFDYQNATLGSATGFASTGAVDTDGGDSNGHLLITIGSTEYKIPIFT